MESGTGIDRRACTLRRRVVARTCDRGELEQGMRAQTREESSERGQAGSITREAKAREGAVLHVVHETAGNERDDH